MSNVGYAPPARTGFHLPRLGFRFAHFRAAVRRRRAVYAVSLPRFTDLPAGDS